MRIKKVEDPINNFTADQLDYMLYVDGLTQDKIIDSKGKNLSTTLY